MKQITIVLFCTVLLKKVSPQNERPIAQNVSFVEQPAVIKSPYDMACPTVSSANNSKIQWPSALNWTLSDPPCTDLSKEFLYRNCENGVWDREPKCDYIQPKTLPQCPDGFIESTEFQICYFISQPQSFPPKCPFQRHILPFDSYKAVVQNMGPFWMPVQRDLRNGLGFMTWIEASPMYGTTFEDDYIYGNFSEGKNCILYHNDSFIEAVSCDEKHFGICAYSYFTQLKSHLCDPTDSCYPSSYLSKQKCVCLNANASEDFYYLEAEFIELYQNNIYAKITNETCSIALKKTEDGTYIWNNTKEEIHYTYWSKDVIFDDTHVYGAITPKGWILTEQPAFCKLFEKEIKAISPATLSLNVYNNATFNLSISSFEAIEEYNSEILVYCFTDADALNLTYRYSHIEKKTYSFRPLEDGPGTYWCKAFTYDTLDVVESNEVFLRQQETFPYEFVGILELVYKGGIDPLSKENVDFIEEEFFSELYDDDHFKRFYNLRIMKILDVDSPNRRILINIHFTYMRRSFTDSHDQEFEIVRESIETFVRKHYDLQITVVDFLSADFCMKETKSVRWKKAKIGQTIVSTEPCLDINDKVVNLRRTCGGDFIAGAKWLVVNETYQTFKHSNLTEDILNLLDRKFNNNEISTSEIQNISRHYEEFSPLDVYLLENVTIARLKDDFTINQNEAEQYVQIIGNVLEVEKNVLLESQLKFKTMDIFLFYLSEIMWQIYKRSTYFDDQEFCHKSFYVRIMNLSERKNNNLNSTKHCYRRPQILAANYFNYIDAVNDIELENAIWLNFSTSVDHSPNYYVIIFAIYNHSPLFLNPPEVIDVPIFKIISRDTTPIYTYQKVEDPAHKSCSSWTYQKDFNFSRENHNSTTYHHPYVICEYQSTYNYNLGLIKTKIKTKITLTESLMSLVNSSNITESEAIDKLRNISEKYDGFTAIDLHLTSIILEELEDSEFNLDDLVTIISNLQEVSKSVLHKSQKEYEATDNILRSLDKIVINHNYSSPVNVTSHNAMILIQNLKEANFTGLVLKNQENFYSEIIHEHPNIEHLENYDSALVLSPELKEQLDDTAAIRLIIFAKNSLFVENMSGSKNISKIFDVLLPGVGDYSGPISVYHRIPKNQYIGKCAYWYYNKTIPGSWVEDHVGKDLSSLTKCDYSHTTHFALLLIDKFSHNLVLEMITNINCVISFVGLVCVFFTALLFEKWRKQIGHKVLLNFNFVMILQTIFFYSSSIVGSSVSADSFWCTITGIALHYFTVSEFYWMVIIGILQYKRYVDVLWAPPSHMLLKICLCGWLFPFVHIASVFVLDRNNYNKNLVDLCYPSGLGLYLGIWLPIIATAAINFIIFIKIIYNVNKKITRSAHLFKNNEALQRWKLTFTLYFLLGLPWIFGLLGKFGLIFVYLFCCTVTLHGFVIFLFFIVFDPNTRFLYLQAFRKCSSKRS